MSFRSDRYEFSLAGPENSQEILNILESGDFKGNFAVMFTRRPDPIISYSNEGDEAFVLIMRDKANGVACALGSYVIRKVFWNGDIKNTCYLTGLKIIPEYQKRLPNISKVYQYIYNSTKDSVNLYYTTILKENIVAQKLLEKRHNGMPEYQFVDDYTVYCFKTKSKCKINSTLSFEKGNGKKLDEFYRSQLKERNLAPVSKELFGLKESDFYQLKNERGEIVAACGVWNQQSYKQYVITNYSGIFNILKHLPLNWFGYPKLPNINEPVNYGSIALFYSKGDDLIAAEFLLSKVIEAESKYDFLMFGLLRNQRLNLIFDRIKHFKYESKLYFVNWDDSKTYHDNLNLGLEVGLL